MDKTRKLYITLILLSLAGVLFAGYLTVKKYFYKVCLFNESCPYFLGQPTCIFGLGIYLVLLSLSILIFISKNDSKSRTLINLIALVSILGIVFSGYFTIQELFFGSCPEGGCNFALILPTCAYGLIMYISIAVISFYLIMIRRKSKL